MTVRRKIIEIDEEKCTGCGECIPNCPEGALQIIDGKARLISDLFCDGLGACIGHCPEGAINVEEREAEPYDERRVMENIVKQGNNVIIAHLEHLKEHGETKLLAEALEVLKEKGIKSPLSAEPAASASVGQGCPGSRVTEIKREARSSSDGKRQESELQQWPIQLHLIPVNAPYFRDADLLIAADCVPFSYANFHQDFLPNKVLIIGCPKLDDADAYTRKLGEIFKNSDIKSITIAHMEVPCCFGLSHIVERALEYSGKEIPIIDETITISGEKK